MAQDIKNVGEPEPVLTQTDEEVKQKGCGGDESTGSSSTPRN